MTNFVQNELDVLLWRRRTWSEQSFQCIMSLFKTHLLRKGKHHCTTERLFWIQVLCYVKIINIYTCLVESKLFKWEVSQTLILALYKVSVLLYHKKKLQQTYNLVKYWPCLLKKDYNQKYLVFVYPNSPALYQVKWTFSFYAQQISPSNSIRAFEFECKCRRKTGLIKNHLLWEQIQTVNAIT